MTFFGYNMNHEPIEPLEAAMLLGDDEARQIALDKTDDWCVSTVFLVFPHGPRDDQPMLYETMTFTAKGEIENVARYATRDAALAGHDQAVAHARSPLAARTTSPLFGDAATGE